MKKKLFTVFLILLAISRCNKAVIANAAQKDENVIQMLLELVEEPAPIEQIVNGNVKVSFSYDENKYRTKKVFSEKVIHYSYENNLLVSETGEHNIQYFYSNVSNDFLCTGIVIDGEIYILVYDEIGNVEYICNEDTSIVCKYEYVNTLPQVYKNVDGELVLNTENNFIGNINPIRYQGWYYDRESKHYYMGKGIYYDAENNLYVNNPYTIKNTRASEPAIIRTIAAAYSHYMSFPTYGATGFANNSVTEAQWNTGKRWYDGLDQTELMARCIFAENDGKKEVAGNNGYYDRVAETVVIMNRVNNHNENPNNTEPTSPYIEVTKAAQFSTINPGNYDAYLEDTALARKVKDKTNTAWQEATLLACTLTYTTSLSDLVLIRTIPTYINTQRYFLGLNYVYDKEVFSISNGSWYYNNAQIKNVALAGVASLQPVGDAKTILYQYYKKGFNIFFEYQ